MKLYILTTGFEGVSAARVFSEFLMGKLEAGHRRRDKPHPVLTACFHRTKTLSWLHKHITPITPETCVTPETPATPITPVTPATPVTHETRVTPESLISPATPKTRVTSESLVSPATPETPVTPET